MQIVALLLLVAMIVVETVSFGERLILRAAVQGLCLAVALAWWLPNVSRGLSRGYVLVLAYLLVLAASASFSIAPGYVFLQLGSVAGVVLFWAAYVEYLTSKGRNPYHFPGLVALVLLGAATAVSLAMAVVRPGTAYQFATGAMRLEGIYQEPASLAATAGYLLGFALFIRTHWAVRLAGVGLAVVCLFMTGSRTFMLAAVVAIGITMWRCYPQWRRGTVAASISVGIVMLLGFLVDWSPDSATAAGYLRTESIETLTGRTVMWDRALSALPERLFLGYGFTLGAVSLATIPSFGISPSVLDESLAQTKLHSGYVQALMDSGIIGFALYMCILCYGLYRAFTSVQIRQHAWILYGIVYVATTNFAETILHSVSVYRSVVAWMIVIFAVSLGAALRRPLPAMPAPRPARVVRT